MRPTQASTDRHGLRRKAEVVWSPKVSIACVILLSSFAGSMGCGAQAGDADPVSAPTPAGETSSEEEGGTDADCTELKVLGASDNAIAGIVKCAGDYIAHDISANCRGGGAGELAFTEGSAECDTDSDCPPEARCLGSKPYSYCRYAGVCTADSDCPSGQACFCALDVTPEGSVIQEVNKCLPAECETDAECGDFPCVASRHHCITGLQGSFCHGPADECQSSSDCEGSSYCRYDLDEARWHCQPYHTCR